MTHHKSDFTPWTTTGLLFIFDVHFRVCNPRFHPRVKSDQTRQSASSFLYFYRITNVFRFPCATEKHEYQWTNHKPLDNLVIWAIGKCEHTYEEQWIHFHAFSHETHPSNCWYWQTQHQACSLFSRRLVIKHQGSCHSLSAISIKPATGPCSPRIVLLATQLPRVVYRLQIQGPGSLLILTTVTLKWQTGGRREAEGSGCWQAL